MKSMSALEALINNMKAEIIALKNEEMSVNNALNANKVIYEIDEEDLTKEPIWIRQKRNSKNKKQNLLLKLVLQTLKLKGKNMSP